jgi:hypothetical protein
MAQFERGFKAWAERTSLSLRKDLGLTPSAPFDAYALAKYLDIQVLTPRQVPGLSQAAVNQLLVNDPWGWSAATLAIDGYSLIVYNPQHSKGRQASDLAHESAHLILDHKPAMLIMSQDGEMVIRTYNQQQEDEANWLAGCMLLPREALWSIRRRQLSDEQACSEFGVSPAMLRFRLNTSGVNMQLHRTRRANRH